MVILGSVSPVSLPPVSIPTSPPVPPLVLSQCRPMPHHPRVCSQPLCRPRLPSASAPTRGPALSLVGPALSVLLGSASTVCRRQPAGDVFSSSTSTLLPPSTTTYCSPPTLLTPSLRAMGVRVRPVGYRGAARPLLLAVVRCRFSSGSRSVSGVVSCRVSIVGWCRSLSVVVPAPVASRRRPHPAPLLEPASPLLSGSVVGLPPTPLQLPPSLSPRLSRPSICCPGLASPSSAVSVQSVPGLPPRSSRPFTCCLDSVSAPPAVPAQSIPRLLSVACRSPGGPIGTVSLHLCLV